MKSHSYALMVILPLFALMIVLGCSNQSRITGNDMSTPADNFSAYNFTNPIPTPTNPAPPAPPFTGQIFKGTGMIVYVPLENGFFGILSDDGARYDPVKLDRKFQQDGLRVRFTLQLSADGHLVHMWGIDVDIIAMEPIGNAPGHGTSNSTQIGK